MSRKVPGYKLSGICSGIRPEIFSEIPEIFFRNLEILVQKSRDFEIRTQNFRVTNPPPPNYAWC